MSHETSTSTSLAAISQEVLKNSTHPESDTKYEEIGASQLPKNAEIYHDERFFILKDGAIVAIGPLHTSEQEELYKLYAERMTNEAMATRWFGPRDRNEAGKDALRLADISDNVVIRVISSDADHPEVQPGTIIGHSILTAIDAKKKTADVAFVVANKPPYNFASGYEKGSSGELNEKSLGLGRLLLTETCRLAKNKRIRRIKTEALGTNGPMVHLFQELIDGNIEGIKPLESHVKRSFNEIDYDIKLKEDPYWEKIKDIKLSAAKLAIASLAKNIRQQSKPHQGQTA